MKPRDVGRMLFAGPLNTTVTLVLGLALSASLIKIVNWAVLDAAWHGDAESCRQVAGACWVFVWKKITVMVVGYYPEAERWRPVAVVLLFVLGIAAFLGVNVRRALLVWAGIIPAAIVLMAGGIFGLDTVPTQKWSGLPLSLIIASLGLAAAFPIGVGLALVRRSDNSFFRYLSIAFVELIRGVPLVSILFMASIMLPLFLPPGVSVDKIARAITAIGLFNAAYISEIVRGGINVLPEGQEETGYALGLRYWQVMAFVTLPQALRAVVPPLTSHAIICFKDTSLIAIVGLIDFLASAKAAANDPAWLGFTPEALCVAAVVYFVLCKSIAMVGRKIERDTQPV